MKLRKNKKGAIELSMSTIIVIILGVTLLTLGIMFVRGIMTKVTDLTDISFDDADKSIRDYMTQGNSKFYILGADTTMQSKSTKTTYAGVRNIVGKDESFLLKVKSADGKSDIKWITVPTVAVTVPAGQTQSIQITLKVPGEAATGETYMYLIEAYDSKNKIYGNEFLSITIE